MPKLYNSMTAALQDHWKAHSNAYPQKFVLTEQAHQQLNNIRHLVSVVMVNKEPPGWENAFLGVPIDGISTPLAIG